jgi:diaminohydroxyphosphoribosylaminopyrimidine deaminase/5-amino-6-(5-phosphoribosylamino)uracil reductase
LIVVDSRLEIPLNAKLLNSSRTVYIYAAVPNDAKKAALEEQGAKVIYIPGVQSDTQSKVDLRAMLQDLAQREVNEVHVEAGHKLNGSLMRECLVDELLVYLAPKLVGEGLGMAQLGPLSTLADAIPLAIHRVERVGPDLRIVARIADRSVF